MKEDNVVQPKANQTMAWYKGAVLTDTIDSIVLPDDNKIVSFTVLHLWFNKTIYKHNVK